MSGGLGVLWNGTKFPKGITPQILERINNTPELMGSFTANFNTNPSQQTANMSTIIGAELWDAVKASDDYQIQVYATYSFNNTAATIPFTILGNKADATKDFKYTTGTGVELYNFDPAQTQNPNVVVKLFMGMSIKDDGSIRFACWREQSGSTAGFINNVVVTRVNVTKIKPTAPPTRRQVSIQELMGT